MTKPIDKTWFGQIPGEVVAHLIEHDATPSARLVAMALMWHCSIGDPVCKPGTRRLCDVTGLAKGTVVKGVKELVDIDLIEATPGRGRATTTCRFKVWRQRSAAPAPDTPKPKQPAPDKSKADPRILSLLETYDIKGRKLIEAASNPKLSFEAAMDLGEQSDGKDNPAAWLVQACIKYEGSSKPKQAGDGFPEPRAPHWSDWRFMKPEVFGDMPEEELKAKFMQAMATPSVKEESDG